MHDRPQHTSFLGASEHKLSCDRALGTSRDAGPIIIIIIIGLGSDDPLTSLTDDEAVQQMEEFVRSKDAPRWFHFRFRFSALHFHFSILSSCFICRFSFSCFES